MMLRAWMVALTGLGLMVTSAPSLTAATGTDPEPADPLADVKVAALLEYVDEELARTINEMGGDASLCPPCPPGMNCCTANCIISCCTAVCPTGAVPRCQCSFFGAECYCETSPRARMCDYSVDDPTFAGILGDQNGLLLVGSMIANCPNHAGTCGSNGTPALGQIGIEVAPGVAVYVDDRNYLLGNGLWIYVESNGEDNLQRGGQHPVLGAEDAEVCNESGNPDTLIL